MNIRQARKIVRLAMQRAPGGWKCSTLKLAFDRRYQLPRCKKSDRAW